MGIKDWFVKNTEKEPSPSKKKVYLIAPFSGTVVSLDDVPDEVFSQRMLGEGVAIEPSSFTVSSVVEAPYSIFTTCHAISYEGPDDLEIIVHIGINTVGLKGEGFRLLQQELEGDVPVGTPLIEIDAELIKKKDIPLISPIIVTAESHSPVVKVIPNIGSQITQGEPLLEITY